MNQAKKLLSILLCTLLLCAAPLALAAEEPTLTIGIIQLMDHPSLGIIYDAIMTELAMNGVAAEVKILNGNAQGEYATAVTLANQFIAEGATLLVPITTPCAQAAVAVAAESEGVSVLFTAVTDPWAAGIVGEGAPDIPVSGVSDEVQVYDLFDMAQQLTPGFETIGFLYNAGEANSVSSVELGKAYCADNGLKYEETIVSNSAEVAQAAAALAEKADILFTSNDNTVASAMPVYAQAGLDTGTPIYVGADTMVADGGLATLGIDYTTLGKQTASMIRDFVDGAPVGEMPVQKMLDAQVIINTDTAEALGISIPEELAAKARLIKTGEAL